MYRSTNPQRRPGRVLRTLLVTSTLALPLALAGCGVDSEGGGAADTSTLTIGVSDALQGGIAPQTNCSHPLLTLTYEPLINVAPDGGYRPGLAESWEYSDENKVFTLKLREDAVFADGTPVNAQAVVDSLVFNRDNPGLLQVYLKPMTSIEAVDEWTVRVTQAEPFPIMETLLSNNYHCNFGHIISEAGLADPTKLATQTFGAGPYVLDTDATVANSSYTLVPNEEYFDKSLQHWEKIVLKVFKDPNTSFDALQTGQVQVDTFGAPNLRSNAESAGMQVSEGAPAGPGIMIWDDGGELVPALKDERVRQALGYALDRNAIAKAVPGTEPLDQFAMTGVAGHDDDLPQRYTYDVDKAKQLMADAGYANGFDMELATFTASDPIGPTLAQALIPYLEAIGVRATVKPVPDSSFFTEIAKKQYPASVSRIALNGGVFHNALRLYKRPYSDIWNPWQNEREELAPAYQGLATATTDADVEETAHAFNAAATEYGLMVPVLQTHQLIYSKGIAIGTASPLGGFDWANWKPSS